MRISYPVPVQLRFRPHRLTKTDGLDRISVRVCPHIRGENKHSQVRKQTRSTKPQTMKLICTQRCHVCMKCFSPSCTHSTSSCAADSITSDLPAASGVSLPTLHLSWAGLSLTVTWPWWRCQVGDPPNVTRENGQRSSSRAFRGNTQNSTNPNARLDPGLRFTTDAVTPVHVNQKGTHSEDKRYGRGSESDSLIMSWDSCITILGNNGATGKGEKKTQIQNQEDKASLCLDRAKRKLQCILLGFFALFFWQQHTQISVCAPEYVTVVYCTYR